MTASMTNKEAQKTSAPAKKPTQKLGKLLLDQGAITKD